MTRSSGSRHTPSIPQCLAAITLLVSATSNAASGAALQQPTATDYDALPTAKAQATSHNDDSVTGVAYGINNDVAAATIALQRCEAARSPASGPCEINRLNAETVTRGRDILAAVPQTPHPLYLWKYTGPSATVFLAGSIHLLKPSLYPLPVQYQQAYERTEHLVLEVNTDAYEPADIQRQTLAMARLPADTRLPEVLPEHLYTRLLTHLDRYGLAGAAIDGIKPSLLMNQLVVARLLALGYLPEHGVEEHFLLQIGSRKVEQLESLESQLKLLFEQPMSVQIQLLADTLDQEMEIEPILTGLVIAWLSGDDAALESLFEAQAGDSELVRDFNEQLLDQRNVQMVERIEQIIATGSGDYFILVGAAHYLGENGIPALLRARGINGRRITSDTPLAIINSD